MKSRVLPIVMIMLGSVLLSSCTEGENSPSGKRKRKLRKVVRKDLMLSDVEAIMILPEDISDNWWHDDRYFVKEPYSLDLTGNRVTALYQEKSDKPLYPQMSITCEKKISPDAAIEAFDGYVKKKPNPVSDTGDFSHLSHRNKNRDHEVVFVRNNVHVRLRLNSSEDYTLLLKAARLIDGKIKKNSKMTEYELTILPGVTEERRRKAKADLMKRYKKNNP